MTKNRVPTALTTVLLAAALVGCSGGGEQTATPEPAVSATEPAAAEPAADEAPAADDASAGEPLAHLSGCEDVEALVAPFVEGIELTPDSTVDEWGVSCSWETPQDATELAEIRSVSVSAVTQEPGAVAPDVAAMRELMEEMTELEDPWLTERGGVAYSMTMDTAVAAVVVTTVWLPEVEVTVSGGQWAQHPALDGRASLEVTKQLLG